MPQDLGDLDLWVEADRRGRVTVGIQIRSDHTPIQAVLNRGLPQPDAADPPEQIEQFRKDETLAAWWSALAHFPGPVINRPSASGFIPNLDTPPLFQADATLAPAATYIGTGPPPPLDAERVNVHTLPYRRHVGSIAPASTPRFDPSDIHLFTGFNPSRVRHLLLAGDHLFDLSTADGRLADPLAGRTGPLAREMRRRGATFCLAVLEPWPRCLRVVHASPFPAIGHYQHIEASVHRALMEYLMP